MNEVLCLVLSCPAPHQPSVGPLSPPHPDKRVLSVDAIVGWREEVLGSPSSALSLLCILREPGQLWLCPYIEPRASK